MPDPGETARQIAERIVYDIGADWPKYAAAVDDEHRDHEAHTDALATLIASALTTASAQAEQEIAEAREACPSVRMQDHFDAALLKLIDNEVTRGFKLDSWLAQAQEEIATLKAERDAARAAVQTARDDARHGEAPIYEDTLPEMPQACFDALYPHSWVDGVRLYPSWAGVFVNAWAEARRAALREAAEKLDEIGKGPFTGDGIIGPLHAVGLAQGYRWAADSVRALAANGAGQ